ncbi:MAG: hypothetical protein WBB28_00920 [Crinalium sp.]
MIQESSNHPQLCSPNQRSRIRVDLACFCCQSWRGAKPFKACDRSTV